MFASWLVNLYRWMLRLYPSRFRADFSAEMETVFHQCIMDGSDHRSRFDIYLGELIDFPGSLIWAYWHEIKEGLMNPENRIPSGWGQVTMAGLPHVVIGITLSLPQILYVVGEAFPKLQMLNRAFFTISSVMAAVLFLVLFGIAWRQRWPRWSASLFSYGFLILAVLTTWLGNQLIGNSPSNKIWFGLLFAVVGIFVLLWILYSVGKTDPVRSTLVVIPLVVLFWQVIMEFTLPPARLAVTLAAWLLAGLTAAWVSRKGSVRTGLLAVTGLAIVVGLGFATARNFFVDAQAHPSMYRGDLAGLADLFILPTLGICTLVIGPVLLLALHRTAVRFGGGQIFKFALAGFVMELVGVLGAYIWFLSAREDRMLLKLSDSFGTWLVVLGYLGGVMFLVGAVLVLFRIRTNLSRGDRLTFALLTGILFTLPPAGVMPLAFAYGNIPHAMPFGMAWLNQQVELVPYIIAMIWVMVGTYTAVRMSPAKDSGTYNHPSPAR